MVDLPPLPWLQISRRWQMRPWCDSSDVARKRPDAASPRIRCLGHRAAARYRPQLRTTTSHPPTWTHAKAVRSRSSRDASGHANGSTSPCPSQQHEIAMQCSAVLCCAAAAPIAPVCDPRIGHHESTDPQIAAGSMIDHVTMTSSESSNTDLGIRAHLAIQSLDARSRSR